MHNLYSQSLPDATMQHIRVYLLIVWFIEFAMKRNSNLQTKSKQWIKIINQFQ